MIFVGQSYLEIKASVGEDITAATLVEIKYIKPDLTPGTLSATILDADDGVISHVLTDPSFLDQAGEWTFWAYITVGARKIPGRAHKEYVYAEGEL